MFSKQGPSGFPAGISIETDTKNLFSQTVSRALSRLPSLWIQGLRRSVISLQTSGRMNLSRRLHLAAIRAAGSSCPVSPMHGPTN